MKIIEKKQELETTTYLIEVDSKLWADAQKKAKKEILANLQIPGFRKGHVPENKAGITDVDLMQKGCNAAVDDTMKEFWTEFDKNPDEKINPNVVTMDFDKFTTKEFSIRLTFENVPEIDITGYDKIKLNYTKPEVTDKEIDHEISNLIKRDYMLSSKDGAITNGDMVKFDFKGFVNDKAFEGGEAEDYELEIGSGNFIPGFEEQMVGLEKGEKKSIKVTFPKDYQSEELAGKEARFDLNIKEVSTITRPTLDNAYIAKLKMPGVTNETELRNFYRNYILELKNQYANAEPKEQIRTFLTEKTKISFVPKMFIDQQYQQALAQHKKQAENAKLDFKEYIKENLKLKDVEDFEKDTRAKILNSVKYSLAIGKLIKELNIKVEENEIIEEIKKVAAMYGMPADNLLQDPGMKDRMQSFLIESKMFDKLIELNVK